MVNLMNGSYNGLGLEVLDIMKGDPSFFFNLRKMRNALKDDPTCVEFHLNTRRIVAKMKIRLLPSERDLFMLTEVKNKDECLKNNAYFVDLKLHEYFESTAQAWRRLLGSL